MTDHTTYHSEHACIYPGEYKPPPWKEKGLREELKACSARVIKPPVNIIELADHYKVEMAVPGFEARDFFIHTCGCKLAIVAINKSAVKKEEEHYHIRDFACSCIQRHITLPANTDTNFASAAYQNGILTLCFYKTKSPSLNQPGRIIVY